MNTPTLPRSHALTLSRSIPLLLGVLALLRAAPLARAAAPDAITVAVYDFTCNTGMVLSKDTTALVTAGLSADGRLNLVERAQLKKALSEQALGLSGNINFDAAAKVGQLTGARVLVSGRAMRLAGSLVITASIIGTETSRSYSEQVQGPLTNLVGLTATLSQQIADTIVLQASNFVGQATRTRERLIEDIVQKTKGKQLPTLSIEVKEGSGDGGAAHQTAQNELGLILQKAGFELLDEKADRRPEVLITGTAIADGGDGGGHLFTCHARLELQAQARKTGKILSLDHQEATATDLGRQTAERLALEKAADQLAERLVPLLAR